MAGVRRLIVGISGATGTTYGIRLLELLRDTDIETHVVISPIGEVTRAYEMDITSKKLRCLADVSYDYRDMGAAIASGSFPTIGMIVVPCSVKTLAEIACGFGHSLIARAADVVLKERKKLVLAVRETPLNLIHVRNMVSVTEAGGIIFPPVPAFYTKPESIDEMVTDSVCRMLDLFDIDLAKYKRWGEDIDLKTPSLRRGSPCQCQP